MEQSIYKKYESWLNEITITPSEKEMLKNYTPEEIESCFGADLEFGTAGIRGVMGVGTNRMNIYVIRQATQGLAEYLLANFKNPSVAIAYDSRNNSEKFAKETASVLAANGIKVYIFRELMPVPSLSFAVRKLKTSAGVVITASHNPKQYNGYKVYGSDGCQMTPDAAKAVLENIRKIPVFSGVKRSTFAIEMSNEVIQYIPDKVIEKYYASVLKQSILSPKESERVLRITYTPLHGSGLKPVTTVLKEDGFDKIDIVEEQRLPDGNFTTCPYPNPELKEAMELGIKLMLEKNNDILIATDPDSDRAGVVVNQNGEPVILTGNEMGILLFDFIVNARIEAHKLPTNAVVVKTIVSTDLINLMAKKYGVKVIDVLTGFKFIGEQIHLLELERKTRRFILGFEESCGYLTNPKVRDKDAVNAMLLICEMANYYKTKGITLVDRLNQLYTKYGAFKTGLLTYEFQGVEGAQKIKDIMKAFREKSINDVIPGIDHVGDYLLGEIKYADKVEPTNLPKSDVVKFFLKDAETITIRPSGTEPKLKAYVFAKNQESLDSLKAIIDALNKEYEINEEKGLLSIDIIKKKQKLFGFYFTARCVYLMLFTLRTDFLG